VEADDRTCDHSSEQHVPYIRIYLQKSFPSPLKTPSSEPNNIFGKSIKLIWLFPPTYSNQLQRKKKKEKERKLGVTQIVQRNLTETGNY